MKMSALLSIVLSFVLFVPVIVDATAAAYRHIDDFSKEEPMETITDLPRKARLALFKVQEYQDAGEPERAVEALHDFLKRNADSDHYLIRFFLANSLSQIDDGEGALANYRATVELEPRYRQGWLNLGEMAYNLGRYELAADAIWKGYELDPEKPTRLIYYASVAYLLAEKPDKAAPLLEELVSGSHGDPKMEWCRALVSVCLSLGDEKRGNRVVSRMLGVYPDDPDAWHIAFQYAASISDYERAAVGLTITGYLRELSREEIMQLADLYSVIKVPARASSYYDAALGDEASTKELERLASAYIASYDTKSALNTLQRAIDKEPTPRLWSLMGDLHYMDKDYRASYVAFEQCARLDPENGRPYLMMGYCSIEMANYDEAIEKLEMATDFPDQEKRALQLVKRARIMMSNGSDN